MTGLTEKLKELLMATGHFNGYHSDFIAERIAQHLAPEIEKMLPRWVPVSEIKLKDGVRYLVWDDGFGACKPSSSYARFIGGSWIGVHFHPDRITHVMEELKGPVK